MCQVYFTSSAQEFLPPRFTRRERDTHTAAQLQFSIIKVLMRTQLVFQRRFVALVQQVLLYNVLYVLVFRRAPGIRRGSVCFRRRLWQCRRLIITSKSTHSGRYYYACIVLVFSLLDKLWRRRFTARHGYDDDDDDKRRRMLLTEKWSELYGIVQ